MGSSDISSAFSRFFAPTVWLSGRLTFSKKYILIGVVVLLALAALSMPLIDRARQDSELAGTERQGLKSFVIQSRLLEQLVALRSQTVEAVTGTMPYQLNKEVTRVVDDARDVGIWDEANRLEASWREASNLDATETTQRRFAVLTGVINAVLGLTRESARTYHLNIDPRLDATLDMLTNRLPLVLDTLGKQRDAVSMKSAEMAPYALGAQVVLMESVAGLKAGIAQQAEVSEKASALRVALEQLLEGIAKQQDTADIALNDPRVVGELRTQAKRNLEVAGDLLNYSVEDIDAYLAARIVEANRAQMLICALLIGVVCAIFYLFAGIYLSTLRSLRSLSIGTAAFCSGRLETRISVKTQDELVLVARNFNNVADEVGRLLDVIRQQNESRQRELEVQVQARTLELAEKNEQLRAASKRAQEELSLARSMQLATLPQEFPDEKMWSVYACMYPARELGGDFYDCFNLPDGRFGILVADVSGKGVGAAFFMAVSRTILLDLAMEGGAPSEVFVRANDILCERNPMDLFVTACYGIFDPNDGSFIHASAGHHAPLLRNVDGQVKELACTCDIALGVVPRMSYSDNATHLDSGDVLLMYTDGVTEAFSAEGEAYGDDRLHMWFSKLVQSDHTVSSIVMSLVEDVSAFVNGAEASDDLTCLVLNLK